MAKLGYTVILIDIRFDSSHDITKRKLQNAISFLDSCWIRFVRLDDCICNKSSRARNMRGGPAMLRNSDHVMGLPDIRLEADRQKVAQGNGMMLFAS